jgi:hypothetical protein
MASTHADDGLKEAPAQETLSPWSGMLASTATQRSGSRRLNPENVVRMPRGSYELAGVLDYQVAALSARLRVRSVRRDIPFGNGNPPAQEQQADLTQLNWTHPLHGDWSISVGRMNPSFDDGQSFHPLGFFEDMVRGTDFEDLAGRNRGFPLVMLQRLNSEGGVRLVYSDDRVTETDYVYGDPNPNLNRGLRQAVLSWRHSEGPWTWTSLLQHSWPGHTGVGAGFSWVPANEWSLYGATFAAPGNPLPIHLNVALGRGVGLDGRDVYLDTSPWSRWQANDGRWRQRWLLGAQYSWENGHGLQVELWRDGLGMSNAAFMTWRQVLAFHDGLQHAAARRVNLGYDLEALRTSSGVHLFSRHSVALETGASLQTSLLLSQDHSGSLSIRWQGPRWKVGTLSLEAWHRFGSTDSRYGAVPDNQGVNLVWRILF